MIRSKKIACKTTRLLAVASISAALLHGVCSHAAIAKEKLPKCLYISSYHSGYDWSDGVETGIRKTLLGECELRQFDMDTKRKRDPEDLAKAVRKAIAIIESWRPDVVITSDDNAAKHLIVPHYSESQVPFVFSGINWTVEEYGFPFPNVTGIVEVAPIEPMLREAMEISEGSRGVYIGADTLTEEKNFSRISQGASRIGGVIDKILVSTAADWREAFLEATDTVDYIVMGSNSGIEDWDKAAMAAFVQAQTNVISVTNHGWMMHVSALGYTKIPEEHGEWAAEAALEILGGSSPAAIPIVTNRKWDLWVNQSIVDSAGAELSARFTRKAKRFVLAEE